MKKKQPHDRFFFQIILNEGQLAFGFIMRERKPD